MVSTFTIKCVATGCSILSSKQQWFWQSSFYQLFWSACYLKTLTCYPSFYAAVLELFDYFALTDRQVGFWCGLAGRLHRWLCTLFHFVSHAQHFRFVNSKSVSPHTGEACWWTIHPASKQRSEGEKVRVGDDLILVSVSSERYLVTIILFTCILSDNLLSVNLSKITTCALLSICPTQVVTWW